MEASLFTRASYVVLALCLAATDSQLTIEDPVGRAVPTNGSLHLSCDSPHSAHTAWFRGQPAAGPVPVTGDPRIITNGGDLWFTSFHASEHAGLYYCLVTTDTGEAVRSCPAHLTHASIHHHFSEEPEDTTVGQGATALLRCHLSDSNPPAIYRWKKDGHPISPDNGRVVLSPSGYLYIRNVTETDEGEYQCLAENEVTGKSRRSRVSSLSVNASLSSPPPRLIALPETPVTVPEGERVVFECATDSATATISWSHNSLVSLPHNSNMLPTGPLVIENATVADRGHYVCSLVDSNGWFVTAAFVSLTVTSSPTVTVTGSETVAEGSHLSLACSVTSTSPDPVTVVWFKGPVVLQSSQHDTMGTVVNTLSRDSAHPNDTGLYQCMAYDSAGCGRAVAMVTVETTLPTTTPPTTSPPPLLTVSATLLNSTFGRCTVIGDIANIGITFGVWEMNGKILDYFRNTDGNSTHIVKDIQFSASGQYICKVRLESSHSISDSVLYLQPTSPPPHSTVVDTTPTSSSPVATPRPSLPTSSPVTVSVSMVGSVAHCIVSGDISLVFTGLWLLDGDLHGQFLVPSDSLLGFFTSTHLSEAGTYTCQVVLTTGTFVSDSVDYLVVETSVPPLEVTSPVAQPSPTSSPMVPPPPPVTVTVAVYGSLVHCVVQGDLSLILTGLWWVNGHIREHFPTPPDTGVPLLSYSTDLSEDGTYTCVIALAGGLLVDDSVDALLPTTPPSPSPSPTEPAPSVTLVVQKLSTSVKCIVDGDIDAIATALWIVHREDGVLSNFPFTVDTSRSFFYSSLPLSVYGTYTCHVTLSNEERLTGSVDHPPPPSPSPSPSPSSTAPTLPPVVDLRRIEGGFMVCTVALARNEISYIMFSLDGSPIDGEPMFGETTAVLTMLATDPGSYLCIVTTTDGRILTAQYDITPPPTTPTILPPPTSLTAEWVYGDDGSLGNIRVTWEEPAVTEGLLGYKINWDPPTLVEKVGRKLLEREVYQYTITIDVDVELPYVILVWAFTSSGDQEAARIELPPAIVVPPLCPEPCPSSSVLPSPSPLPPLILTDCEAVSPNSATLSWQINKREKETVEVSYGCQAAGTNISSTLPLAASTSLSQLLPDCRYVVRYQSQSCFLTTPPGPIAADFNVTLVDGALVVTWWGLPPELGGVSGEGVKVEVNVSGEWVEVGGANPHTLYSTTPNRNTIHIRFSIGEWSSILSVPVTTPPTNETTPTPTEGATDSSPSLEDQVFLYGTVISVAVLVCVVVVAVIMGLKYIQMTHRDTDKVTDHRLYQRQQFHRMSLEKSSLKKQTPCPNGVNGVNGVNRTRPRSKVTRITPV